MHGPSETLRTNSAHPSHLRIGLRSVGSKKASAMRCAQLDGCEVGAAGGLRGVSSRSARGKKHALREGCEAEVWARASEERVADERAISFSDRFC